MVSSLVPTGDTGSYFVLVTKICAMSKVMHESETECFLRLCLSYVQVCGLYYDDGTVGTPRGWCLRFTETVRQHVFYDVFR